METFENSGGEISPKQMCFAEGSLVRISPSPTETERDSTENGAGSSSNMPVLLASYDRDTSSWRTSQVSLMMDSIEFSGPWPASGMMRSGRLYRRTGLASLISERESSLLPTPVASDAQFGLRLSEEAHRRSFNSDSRVKLIGLLMTLGIPEWMFPNIYERVMGFPLDWTLSTHGSRLLEMPSCPLLESTSEG